jgi:hypothetical protein
MKANKLPMVPDKNPFKRSDFKEHIEEEKYPKQQNLKKVFEVHHFKKSSEFSKNCTFDSQIQAIDELEQIEKKSRK